MARKGSGADLLIGFSPRVRMGKGVEKWQAYESNVYIIAVSPHIHHLAIKFTANEILPDLNSLLRLIGNGRFTTTRIPQIKQHKNGTKVDAAPSGD